jgi:hypothetical protein
MSTRRRTKGDETWNRLLNWTDSQKASERLASRILAREGFTSIDPAHPLGGPDGRKDLLCLKDGISWIVAVYFPNGKQSFKEIRSKFESDARGAISNKTKGFVFFVNQYLTIGERKELAKSAPVEHVEIYHLERIACILDTSDCYDIRLEYLDIEMTKEEQVAFFATATNKITDALQNLRDEIMEEVRKAIQEALSQQRR